MDAVRTGRFAGGDVSLNISLDAGGGVIDEAEVEEYLGPLLERLSQRRRLRFA
jgi:hypothetical protein